MVAELDRLPLLDSFRFIGTVYAPKLISLVVHNENHANGHQRGRKYKDQNPATQCLNHLSARGGSLGIAQGAALREGWDGGRQ
jgi:hypothetical protein